VPQRMRAEGARPVTQGYRSSPRFAIWRSGERERHNHLCKAEMRGGRVAELVTPFMTRNGCRGRQRESCRPELTRVCGEESSHNPWVVYSSPAIAHARIAAGSALSAAVSALVARRSAIVSTFWRSAVRRLTAETPRPFRDFG
jgi:hypothetical protein